MSEKKYSLPCQERDIVGFVRNLCPGACVSLVFPTSQFNCFRNHDESNINLFLHEKFHRKEALRGQSAEQCLLLLVRTCFSHHARHY